jgi:hypothetical protein
VEGKVGVQHTLLPTALCAWQEVVIWRRRKEDRGGAGAGDVEAGVEMQTANAPPPPPEATEVAMNPIQASSKKEGLAPPSERTRAASSNPDVIFKRSNDDVSEL